jgi:outer membrane lipoprotein SlyB
VLSVLLLFFAGCTQPLTTRERGTLAGGALGAGTGALIGAATGAPGAGAAIGGVLGAVAGAVTSDQLQAQDNLLAAQQREIEELRHEVQRQREVLRSAELY